MYTQCPACNTLFRINEQQLAAAGGKVRCGQCNHIYNAQGTLLDSLPAEQISPEPAEPEKNTPEVPVTIPEPADSIIGTDEILEIIAAQDQPEPADEEIHDIDLTADLAEDSEELDVTSYPAMTPPAGVDEADWQMLNLGDDEETKQADSWFDDEHGLPDEEEQETANWFDDEAQDETTSITSPIAEDIDDDDWQMASLGDNKETEETDGWFNADYEPSKDKDSEQDDESISTSSEQPSDEQDDIDLMEHVADYLDDDVVDELLSEENASDIFDEVQQQLSFSVDSEAADNKQAATGIDIPGSWLDDMDKPSKASATSIPLNITEEQEINDAILKSMEQPFIEIKDKQKEHQSPLFKPSQSIVLESTQHLIGQHDATAAPPLLNDAVPLRLRNSIDIKPEVPRSTFKWLLILFSIVMLIALLIFQAVLFRSTELANLYPEWQPLLTKACETLPCRDASRQAIGQIQLISRNISQHPKVKSALLIKAAIVNNASFAQRYPNIQITLSDLTGNKVAQRTFKPREYLGDLYHPFLQMKPGKPVHIALEVLDPGNTAINFEFIFL